MLTTTIGKIALGTAVAATLALVATIIIPIPPAARPTWFDQPLPGAILVEGEHTIRVHLKDRPLVVEVLVIRDGVIAGAVVDSELVQAPGENRDTPYLAEGTYTFTPGTYQLKPRYNGDEGAPVPITITVVAAGGEAAVESVPDPEATSEPTPTSVPTTSATPGPAPTATANPGPVTPAPTPTASSPPVTYAMPYGFVRQSVVSTGANNQIVNWTIRGASPQSSLGSVQWQVTSQGSPAVESNWQSVPCATNLQPDPSSAGNFTCTTINQAAALGILRVLYYRMVLTNGDKTYVGPLQYWNLPDSAGPG